LIREVPPSVSRRTATAIDGHFRHIGHAAAKILEDIFIAEVLHAQSVLFFHQEKSFQDL
jgi:hypothetical protein